MCIVHSLSHTYKWYYYNLCYILRKMKKELENFKLTDVGVWPDTNLGYCPKLRVVYESRER